MNEYENHWDAVIETGPQCEAGSGVGGVNVHETFLPALWHRHPFKGPYGWMIEQFIPGPHADGAGHLVTTMRHYDGRIGCSVCAARLEPDKCVTSWGPRTVLYTAPKGTRATRAAIEAAQEKGLGLWTPRLH